MVHHRDHLTQLKEEEQPRQVGLMGEREWAPSIQFTDAGKRTDSAKCRWG